MGTNGSGAVSNKSRQRPPRTNGELPQKPSRIAELEAEVAQLRDGLNQLTWYHAELLFFIQSLIAKLVVQNATPDLEREIMARMRG